MRDGLQDPEAVKIGQLDVEQEQVRPQGVDRRHRLCAVDGRTQHVDPCIPLQQGSQAVACQRFIFNDKSPDWHGPTLGSPAG
jgi:hypothetical protein